MNFRSPSVALLVLLAGLLLCQISCARPPVSGVPPELIDVWVTDNEKYADRFFTIRGTTLTFGTGEDTSETYIVTSVERVPFVGDSLYTVEYVNSEGDPYRFSFFFRRGDRDREQVDEIRLRNQRYIPWVRRR